MSQIARLSDPGGPEEYPPSQTLDIRVRQLTARRSAARPGNGPRGCLRTDPRSRRPGASRCTWSDCIRRTTRTPILQLPARRCQRVSLRAVRSLRHKTMRFPALRRLVQPDKEHAARTGQGHVVFTSTKPGSGASTLATQTAFALGRLTGPAMLLVDLDLTGGTIGFYLKLEPHLLACSTRCSTSDRLDAGRLVECGGRALAASISCRRRTSPYADPVEPATAARCCWTTPACSTTGWFWTSPAVFHRISLMAIAGVRQGVPGLDAGASQSASGAQGVSSCSTSSAFAIDALPGAGEPRGPARAISIGNDMEKLFELPACTPACRTTTFPCTAW